jgi:hypothetical protein
MDNDLKTRRSLRSRRLAERFAQLDEDTIGAAMRLAHSEPTGGIRDFVPVLVEHTPGDRLSAIADRDEVEPVRSRSAGMDPQQRPRRGADVWCRCG